MYKRQFELVDIPLIKKAASTGKPLIMSTGMASVTEIEDAVNAAKSVGNEQIVLLKCTSNYPASPKDSNLVTISHLKQMFDTEVGLSDHTMGVGAACAAVAFGATVVEKHFTLSRAGGGVDSAFSLEPHELESLVLETERSWQGIGKINYGKGTSESKSKMFRRSLYICEDLDEGEVLTSKNLRIIRPGYGMEPKYYDLLNGRKVSRSIKKGTRKDWGFFG